MADALLHDIVTSDKERRHPPDIREGAVSIRHALWCEGLRLEQVARDGAVNLDAGAHRGGQGDGLDVLALGAGGLHAKDLVEQGPLVLDYLLGR